jgi:hypothetical protein
MEAVLSLRILALGVACIVCAGCAPEDMQAFGEAALTYDNYIQSQTPQSSLRTYNINGQFVNCHTFGSHTNCM